jgi:hypothetical protein
LLVLNSPQQKCVVVFAYEFFAQVLFCNGDRIRDKTDQGWEDTYSGIFLPASDDPCTKTGASDLTLAETYQMDDDEGKPQVGEPSDQLQICPWFLEWYKAETYQVCASSSQKKT